MAASKCRTHVRWGGGGLQCSVARRPHARQTLAALMWRNATRTPARCKRTQRPGAHTYTHVQTCLHLRMHTRVSRWATRCLQGGRTLQLGAFSCPHFTCGWHGSLGRCMHNNAAANNFKVWQRSKTGCTASLPFQCTGSERRQGRGAGHALRQLQLALVHMWHTVPRLPVPASTR